MNRLSTSLCIVVLAAAFAGLAGCERAGASSASSAERLAVQPSGLSARSQPAESPYLGEADAPSESQESSASSDATVQAGPASLPSVSALPSWGARFRGVVNGVHTRRRVVALTFDDGPTARTQHIVDELDAAGAHATFFWVGSRITTDAASYAVAHGEEIANHTWSHPNMRRLSSQEASRQIGLTSQRIAQVTGAPPVWFRSPFNRVYKREWAQIRAHRLLYANYDVTSLDWMKGMSEADIVDTIDHGLRPGGVILLHDSPKHEPAYLPAVLRLLKRRGYEVVTMSELAQMGPANKEPLTLGVKGLGY